MNKIDNYIPPGHPDIPDKYSERDLKGVSPADLPNRNGGSYESYIMKKEAEKGPGQESLNERLGDIIRLMGDDPVLAEGASNMIDHVPNIQEGKSDGRLLVLTLQIELARQILDAEELECFNDVMSQLIEQIESGRSGHETSISYTKTASLTETYSVDMSVTEGNMEKYFGHPMASGKEMGILHRKMESLGFTIREQERSEPVGRSTYRYWLEVTIDTLNE